jgi:hypothetical protein
MRSSRHLIGWGLLLTTAVGWTTSANQGQPNVLRWAEGKSGCTFSVDDDGKYHYGVWTNDFGIEIAVDADEVRKSSVRVEPLFVIFLLVRDRGKGSLSINPRDINLEFVKHGHLMQPAIDPDDFARKMHTDADAFAQQIQREIDRHPEKKTEKESLLRTHEKDVAETQEFLRSRSFRPTQLDNSNSDASGWVFFSAKSKWIGDWKKQEQFVLRIPLTGGLIEFPFALPASHGDLILRRR